VNAPFLMVLFDSVYLIALTSMVGSILFFSFVVAPIVFKVLGPEAAGAFLRALFPRYYQWGAISAAVALPAAVSVPLCFPELRGPWVGVRALVVIAAALVMLYSGNSLTPQINAARDLGPSGSHRFDALHKRSVRLNALVMVMGLGLLIAFAARAKPSSAGIVELTPVERARVEARALSSRPVAPARAAYPGR
jgi:Domain of unknown function (DUF4149)